MPDLDPDLGKRSMPLHSELPSAYFLSLDIESTRCFGPRQTLDLADGEGRYAHWTVILGENGTGKSTLLQALAGMSPTLNQYWDQYVWKGDDYEGWVGFNFPRFFNASLLDEWFDSAKEESVLELGSSIGEEKVVVNFFTKNGLKEFRLWSDPAPSSSPLADARIFGYGASRTFSGSSLQDDEDGGVVESLFNESIHLQSPEEWLLQTDYAARQEGPRQEIATHQLGQVKQALIHVLPDIDDIRIAPPTETRKTARAEFHTPYGWVPLAGLGLGYRTMTAWMVDLASRLFDAYPDSPDPLAEPAVVLVDEIDLHMHPRWQRTIIDYLSERFPKTQFIVTAHSPLIVQSAKDANVVVLRRVENPDGDDYVVIDNDPEIVANWRVDQILTSLFDLETARPPEVEPLLKERRAILGKPELTPEDKGRLRALNREIGVLPTGETPDDLEAMDIIRRAAEVLKDEEDAA